MERIRKMSADTLDVGIAIVIAIVTLTTAGAVWWTSIVASNACGESRKGLLDAL